MDTTYHDNGEAVTITISGNAYANLRKIADAMNAASWTDNDHTPSWAVRYWIGDLIDSLGEARKTCDYANVTELVEDIVNNIDTKAEGDEDRARRDELRAAFDAAGVFA